MGCITHITHKEEKRDIIFELFFRNARGDLYQLACVSSTIDGEEAAVPFKADVGHIIFLEDVACYPVFIKRLYLCIFGIEINPIV